MTQNETAHVVAVVVDPKFGERLSDLAGRAHVWIIDTPINRDAAAVVWRECGGADSVERSATTFSASQTDPPDEIVASILGAIDLHHGEYGHAPPWSVIEVFGATLTARLVAALKEFGFSDFAPTPDGFKSWRANGERDNTTLQPPNRA